MMEIKYFKILFFCTAVICTVFNVYERFWTFKV